MNLLLLRGLVRDQDSWGDFPNRFAAHAPRMNLFFLDLPGVGTEYRRPSPSSIPAIRIEVAKRFHEAIARGRFPAGPWSLLATSLGGMVALDWAQAETDLFQRLILLNTSTADLASPTERFDWRRIPEIFASLTLNRPEISERLVLKATSNRYANGKASRDPKLESLYEARVKERRARPVSRTTFVRQILSAATYRLPEGRPKSKTIVIASEQDRLVNPRCSLRLAERIGASRLVHPWAGHDVVIDDPEWLAREVSEWMGDPA